MTSAIQHGEGFRGAAHSSMRTDRSASSSMPRWTEAEIEEKLNANDKMLKEWHKLLSVTGDKSRRNYGPPNLGVINICCGT